MGKYYVDAVNGSDTTGNGSRKFPYATINKFLSSKTEIVEDTIVMLGTGSYTFDTTLSSKLKGDATIELIGKGKNTTCSPVGRANTWEGVGVSTSTIKFSRMIWTNQSISYVYRYEFRIRPYTKVKFYNVVFENFKTSGLDSQAEFFDSSYSEFYFENCVTNQRVLWASNNPRPFVYKTSNPITIVNCYGTFTQDSHTKYQPTYINTTMIYFDKDTKPVASLDSDYKITDESINLKEQGVYFGVRKWGFVDTLIKMNGNYYNIELENYNVDTQTYNPISNTEITATEFSDYSFNVLDELFVDVTVNGETFKPIDKFDNFNFICAELVDTKVLGLKYQKGMVVRSLDIQTDFYDTVQYLTNTFARTTTTTTNEDGETVTEYTNTTDIRIVFSTDAGDTWFTWDGYGFVTTDIIIPKKMYEDMTDAEKTQWDVAVDEVLTSGVTLDVANSLDYNIDRTQKLRWAYAFRRDTYSDISQVNNTELKYDMKHSYRELQDSEYDFSIFEHSIEITSHIDTTEMKVNAVL